jgi:hypothetical protein
MQGALVLQPRWVVGHMCRRVVFYGVLTHTPVALCVAVSFTRLCNLRVCVLCYRRLPAWPYPRTLAQG